VPKQGKERKEREQEREFSWDTLAPVYRGPFSGRMHAMHACVYMQVVSADGGDVGDVDSFACAYGFFIAVNPPPPPPPPAHPAALRFVFWVGPGEHRLNLINPILISNHLAWPQHTHPPSIPPFLPPFLPSLSPLFLSAHPAWETAPHTTRPNTHIHTYCIAYTPPPTHTQCIIHTHTPLHHK
jgi:hypothetical protein